MADSDSESSFHSCDDGEIESSLRSSRVLPSLPPPSASRKTDEPPPKRIAPSPLVSATAATATIVERESPPPPQAGEFSASRPPPSDTTNLQVLDASDSDGSTSSDAEEEMSVAQRRKLIEEAQKVKEPEPALSSADEAESPLSPSPVIFKDLFTSGSNTASNIASGGVAGFGGLFSGLVTGGLDVLETLGKKTFETLTVKDEVRSHFTTPICSCYLQNLG